MGETPTVMCSACHERVAAETTTRCAQCGRACCGPCSERQKGVCPCVEQRAKQQPIQNPAKQQERFEGALRQAIHQHGNGLSVAVVVGTIETIKIELAMGYIGAAKQRPINGGG